MPKVHRLNFSATYAHVCLGFYEFESVSGKRKYSVNATYNLASEHMSDFCTFPWQPKPPCHGHTLTAAVRDHNLRSVDAFCAPAVTWSPQRHRALKTRCYFASDPTSGVVTSGMQRLKTHRAISDQHVCSAHVQRLGMHGGTVTVRRFERQRERRCFYKRVTPLQSHVHSTTCRADRPGDNPPTLESFSCRWSRSL